MIIYWIDNPYNLTCLPTCTYLVSWLNIWTGILWELLELEYYRQIFDCSVLQIRMDLYTLAQHTDILIVETVARSKAQMAAVQD